MATYTASYAVHKTLTAATVDTVTLESNSSEYVEVYNSGASGDITVTTDGSTPTSAQETDCYKVKPSSGLIIYSGNGADVVKLICATANAYSVTGAR